MKLIHSLFSLSLLLALSGLFCTTACQDDAEPARAAWLISTDSLIHAAKVYDGKAFEHVVSTTAAGLRVSEPRRVVPMLPRQLHVTMEGKTVFRRHTLPSVSAYSLHVVAVGDTIYRQKESDAEFNADLDALFHESIGVAPRLFGVKELSVVGIDRKGKPRDLGNYSCPLLLGKRRNVNYRTREGVFHEHYEAASVDTFSVKSNWLLKTKAEPSLYAPSFRLLVWEQPAEGCTKLRFTLTLVDGRSLVAEVPLR
nr:MAG TPA: hypothetical protein [Caudoviricetes sp.]